MCTYKRGISVFAIIVQAKLLVLFNHHVFVQYHFSIIFKSLFLTIFALHPIIAPFIYVYNIDPIELLVFENATTETSVGEIYCSDLDNADNGTISFKILSENNQVRTYVDTSVY